MGDDPAAKSSTVPCSSELALADLGLPTFYPADAAEVLLHGLHAVELSRASGLWSAIKVATAVADGAATATRRARPGSAPTCARGCPAASSPTGTARARGCSAPSWPSSSAASSSPGCRSRSSTSAAAA